VVTAAAAAATAAVLAGEGLGGPRLGGCAEEEDCRAGEERDRRDFKGGRFLFRGAAWGTPFRSNYVRAIGIGSLSWHAGAGRSSCG
jgi:hypothetical protein